MQRRDINIFNLSMMDVISGAMGAFLIIMVILMRHYKEDPDVTAQREAAQKQIDDIERKVQEAIDQLQAATDLDVNDLLKKLEDLKRQLADARREINRTNNDLQAARNRVNQLQARNDELERENYNLRDQIDFKDTFVVTASWTSAVPVDVDLYLEPSMKTDKNEILYFEPHGENVRKFKGDMHFDDDGTRGPDVWAISYSRPGATFKVYVCVPKPPAGMDPVSVSVKYVDDRIGRTLNTIVLDGASTWALAGVVTTNDQRISTLEQASDAERAAERRAVEARMSQSGKQGR